MEEEMETTKTRIPARSSFLDAVKGCGLTGMNIDKEELKRRVQMPKYLREAMIVAIRSKDSGVTDVQPDPSAVAPDVPIVLFVNSRSGGRHGAVLKGWVEQLLGVEQVFDLSIVKPSEFVQYGLACLENLAIHGDTCAKAVREKLRIMVAGGDGTVGWVLGCLGELYAQNRGPIPPTGIIPLGTGNDLSRTFDWGGSFPYLWRSALKRSFHKAATGPLCQLDSWQVVVSMPAGDSLELPYSLKVIDGTTFPQDNFFKRELSEEASCFGGVFYNYFSIGMDAQVAYGFHHLRDKKPYLAQGPISNKVIYSGYSCTQGWFCTPFSSNPGLRGLNNILQLYIKKADSAEWESIQIPSSVRAIVALNLPNYGSGRHPWGQPKPEYLEKRGFVEAHVDDGLIEIVGLKQGWHATFVMTDLISAKHIAQAAAVRLEIRGGQWKRAYMQMDGEPWKQPIKNELSTFVEIKRVPHRSILLSGD